LEVITETGRRRWFSRNDGVPEARIVEEMLVLGAVVSEIAPTTRAGVHLVQAGAPVAGNETG
jgi:hypothetical protein